MEWKKSKLTRWQSGAFRITEDDTADSEGRPFRLESPERLTEVFGTLREAQATASLQNELAVTKLDNERLRMELAEARGAWPTNIDFADALEANHGRGIPLNGTHASDDFPDDNDLPY